MLKNENIICISSIDWDFVWQGHQEIMSTFAKNGNKILFIENTGIRTPTFKDIPRLRKRLLNWFRSIKGFREEMENLFVYSPIFLPFPYSRIARWINKYLLLNPLHRWMKAMEFYEPIIWTFLPTGISLDIINSIDNKLIVYYCIADFCELGDSSLKVKKTEDRLIKRSDLVFMQGEVLKEKCKNLNDRTYVFPFGVKMEAFENFQHSADKIPQDIKDIKRPIIGYIGGVHRHIDFALVRYIAENYPEWSIVLIGPIQTDISKIQNLTNVFFLGQKDFSQLPNYINQFTVGVVPYDRTEYTETVYPTKLNEYHAMGKPVVSTELPEVTRFNAENDNLVFVGKTYEEFTSCISKIISSNKDELVNRRIASAKKNSWMGRIEKMSQLLEDALEKKSTEHPNWQERLLRLYKIARRRMLKISTIALSIYLLIFYTPLVWFAAGPLKISQKPKKVDCIVVFAGGVGESGKAGQGYEERVQHAVNLYKEEYAENIIFSSGFMYAFKEPLVMKALAAMLGVPDEKIILEDKAGNTYENVKFAQEILEEKGWDEIILVSSPYHMRRVALVFNKIASDTKVIYSPVPKSKFYSRSVSPKGKKGWRQINIKQIRGILHEYLGIIYYWWRGYI